MGNDGGEVIPPGSPYKW